MAKQASGTRVGRFAKWGLLLLLLAAVAAPHGSSSVVAAQGPDTLAKVEGRVMKELATKGQATFIVKLVRKADLSPAFAIHNRAERGAFVYERLTSVAAKSQAPLQALLTARGVTYKSFWIINALLVTGDDALTRELAARPEVESILAPRVYKVPEPQRAKDSQIATIEWNIDRINAPQVWSTFGDRGEGIVVASVDTGVQFDHPALVGQYRGNLGGGSFNHNYNWFDPSNVCGNPSLVPCDNVDHGTHTMGTMVGDDGNPGTNQIGVAPHAKWIAAKGCESSSCSSGALLASGQWILAPTDLSGANPRPDLRPHVVNNSWGDGPSDPFYQATVQAWVASGIFPAFANGNAGPSCNTAGVPGAYPESYGVGAFDINNQIASFSSRGPSSFGGITKPNVSAPGVNVRSSVPGNSYAVFSGTSMATPHVAGTVALVWAAAPTLIGDVASTRALFDSTAVSMSDLSCGGTPTNNNVWGTGRLDAFAATDQAPRGPTGTLTGTVTDASTLLPIAGATVNAVGPSNRTTQTNASGVYSMTLPVGSYDVTASQFGYVSQTANGVSVTAGNTTTQDFALLAAPSHSVSGHVHDGSGNPMANATVTIQGTPIPPAVADATGFYVFPSVPEGTYTFTAAAGHCNDPQSLVVAVNADITVDFVLPQRVDSFGYFCQVVSFNYINGDTPLGLTGDDNVVPLSLPFPFPLYGQTYSNSFVATNGYMNFLASNSIFSNSAIPSTAIPNGAIYPFWDDLFLDGSSSTWTKLLGTAPNRQFVIEWRNAGFFGDLTHRVSFEVVLNENGRILTQYTNLDESFGRDKGDSATIGIENETGTVAFQYTFNEASISNNMAIEYRLPPSGFIQGNVTDANDHLALAGAEVRILNGATLVRDLVTDATGFYRAQVPLGNYTVEASKTNYVTASAAVSLGTEGQVVTQDFSLQTALGVVSPTDLEFVLTPGHTRSMTLNLSNTGGAPMTFQIQETGGGRVASTSSTFGRQRNPSYNPNAGNTKGLYVGGTPSGWAPMAPGDVLRSWSSSSLSLAWGVGYTGNVWLSDIPSNNNNAEFTVTGSATGRQWHAGWAGAWPGDMAFDHGRGLMCQVNVGGDNGIYCWDPNTGTVVNSITGSFPWTSISQRGVAYRPDDDSFYIGGWNQGILYHVKGLSYPDKGAVIGQCSPADGNISGLAWNPAFNVVWAATNSPTDTIYELNPDSCAVLSTLAHPNPGFNGAGLEMDEAGNLWMVSQNAHTVYLVDSGVPAFTDVPWLSEAPTSGTVNPGATQPIQVTVDSTGLTPGVYTAMLFVQTNSGRQPTLRVSVRLIVPSYRQGVNSGGPAYLAVDGDDWAADQRFSPGSWGHMFNSLTFLSHHPISGTMDDPLYQAQRLGQEDYRFENLPAGVYQVELRFAELIYVRPGHRLFDVVINDNLVLPAHDIVLQVGPRAADDQTFYLTINGGRLDVRFIPRLGFGRPVINALRVTQRPDR